MTSVVMVVDDDLGARQKLADLVEKAGCEVFQAESGEEALALHPQAMPDLVLLDYLMPEMDGLEVMEQLRELDANCRVVILGDRDDSDLIVKSMKLGAENYLVQPVSMADLRPLLDELRGKETDRDAASGLEGVIGDSEAMQVVFRMIRRVAPTRTTVLIRGESGTGKEVIARAIHLLSALSNKLFVTLDCTNIPNNLMESELFGHERGAFTDARSRKIGLLETASGGTLFLDEIGLLPLDLQAKLLNVLETQRFRRVGGNEEIEVSVRILAATNEDLEKAVSEGRFREDMYYRLNVVPVDIPPLRERAEDVLLIADHYLQWYTSLHGIAPRQLAADARSLMLVYPWPGNVRELKNVIERVVLMTDTRIVPAAALSIDRRSRRGKAEVPIGVLSIDSDGQMSVSFPPNGLTLEDVERQIIQAALAHTGGNVTRAADLLHLSRDTLRYRIAKFDLE